MEKLTAFLLIGVYLAFVGFSVLHIHPGQGQQNQLLCKLCDLYKAGIENVITGILSNGISPVRYMTLEHAPPVVPDDPLQVSGCDPPKA